MDHTELPAYDLWHTKVFGLQTQQWWSDFQLISDIMEENTVKSVIEIGSLQGGLSAFLAMECLQTGATFVTNDIKCPKLLSTPLGKLIANSFTFLHGDCFTNDMLHEIIKTPEMHPLLFLCDGGNKGAEFNHFGKLLSPGDIIGAHDYNIEFLPAHIDQAAAQFNFTSYLPSRFSLSYWYWAKITA